MIIIKAPIELKIRTDLTQRNDSFGERIAGNYALMGLEIGEEELLHMVSAPPEIYLADAGSTTIGGNTFISSRNEEMYNIVNNMLNRILLSVDSELTYQDRTYITDALHKLGIKDDRKFMTEVRNMIEESHLEEDFLNSYFAMALEGGTRELREKTLELTRRLAEKETYYTEASREDFLSESILHRLQTGAIYQIVSNFNKSLSDTRIELQESMISEQENVARRLLVQNFVSNIVKEEPELFPRVEHRTGFGAAGTETPGEGRTAGREALDQSLPPAEREFLERERSEFKTEEQLLTEQEGIRETEYKTAEITYRQEAEPGEAPEAAPGAVTERVILERERTLTPEVGKASEAGQTSGEPAVSAAASEGTEETVPAEVRERLIKEAGAEEYHTERVTEAGATVTEHRETQQSAERTERFVTEQGEVLRTEHDETELVFREGGDRETLEETILDRVTERLTEGGERLTERLETDANITRQTQVQPGTEIERERESRELLREEISESVIPGEEALIREKERLIREGSAHSEKTEIERRIDHTDRYVTEAGEVLRTEHEGADIVLRQEGIAQDMGEEAGQTEESPREIRSQETERIREPGERVITEQQIREQVRDQMTLDHSLVTERESEETLSSDRLVTEPGQTVRTEKEGTETFHEAQSLKEVREEVLRERLREQSALERERLTQQIDTEHQIESAEHYVTEAGEILRIEHEGAELIYREGSEIPLEEGTGEASKAAREATAQEQERIREAGEALDIEQVRTAGQEAAEAARTDRITERRDTEYRTAEYTSKEQEARILSEKERTERLHEIERERTYLEELLREKLQEQSALEQERLSERTEEVERTERTDRYVTEQGEILRTEHEGAELIYREGAESIQEEGAGEVSGTLRETTVVEKERIRETGTGVTGTQPESEEAGETAAGVTDWITERREIRELTSEYNTQEREENLRSERERIETLRDTERERTLSVEAIRERLQRLTEQERELRTERTESEQHLERTEQYVTEVGEILRTEHEGAELIYREEAKASEAGEEGTTAGEVLREVRELERERDYSRERQERERSTERYEEALRSEVRSELREQLESERTLREQAAALQQSAVASEAEQAELIHRDTAAGIGEEISSETEKEITKELLELERERSTERERLERDRTRNESRETTASTVRSELREQLLAERLRAEQVAAGKTAGTGKPYERTERIFREEGGVSAQEGAPSAERLIRENERYRSDNIYERELLEKERTKTEVTEGITSAVLLDVVKTLFHAGQDRIAKGDTWIEYRGALYHTAENTFQRLNVNLEEGPETEVKIYPEFSETINLEQVDFSELHEVTEDIQDVEQIEKTIREMNEMNLQNVERYQQMVQVLKELRPEKKRTGGKERTRQEALSLLDDEQALYESLAASENAEEEERRQVFHEITRLFPDRSVEIFRVVEQYLEGTPQRPGISVTRNNVEAAAEEIRRITAAPPVVTEPVAEPIQTEASELVYRRNDRVTQEELEEFMESFRRTQDRQRREIEQREQQLETERRNTYTVTTNASRNLSRQETEDIEALVSRGVRAQMGAISEQVLQKLEKKLKNEKIRRGI